MERTLIVSHKEIEHPALLAGVFLMLEGTGQEYLSVNFVRIHRGGKDTLLSMQN